MSIDACLGSVDWIAVAGAASGHWVHSGRFCMAGGRPWGSLSWRTGNGSRGQQGCDIAFHLLGVGRCGKTKPADHTAEMGVHYDSWLASDLSDVQLAFCDRPAGKGVSSSMRSGTWLVEVLFWYWAVPMMGRLSSIIAGAAYDSFDFLDIGFCEFGWVRIAEKSSEATRFTCRSVVCAERITEIRRRKGSVCSRNAIRGGFPDQEYGGSPVLWNVMGHCYRSFTVCFRNVFISIPRCP